jgi:hypothetical protein
LSTQACGQHGLQTIEHALSAAGTAAGQAFEMRWPTLQGPNVIVLRRQNQPTAADLRHLCQRLQRVHDQGLAGDGLVLFGLCGACAAACARARDQGVKTGFGVIGGHVI